MPLLQSINNIWSKIINSGVGEYSNFDSIMRIRISNAIAVVGSFFALIYCIFLFSKGQNRLAFNDVLFIGNLMLLYVLNSLGHGKIGTVLTIITVPIMLLYVNHEYGKISTDYFYYACIVLGFYFFKKALNQVLISLFFVCLIILTKYLETVVVPGEFELSVAPYIYLSNTFMSLTILFLSLLLFINEHNRYKIQIDSKNVQLNDAIKLTEKKNKAISVLLKELNHRIKNNLQMVSGLLSIQARNCKDSEAHQKLRDASQRIDSLVILHQQLYKNNEELNPNMEEYVEKLTDHILFASGCEDVVTLKKDIDAIELSIDITIHIGLIINELITNALKYGVNRIFSNNEISIFLKCKGELLCLKVTDTGKNLPKGFSMQNINSGGLDLVNSIVQRYKGKLNIYLRENVTIAEVELMLNK